VRVLEILDTLAATSSRLEKERILRENEENLVLRKVVELALCPYTQFFIRKIPAYENKFPQAAAILDDTLPKGVMKLQALADREVTGHAARDYLQTVLENLHGDDAKVIERIIAKDLRCGVQASTANKIWPGLVAQYPCMLAETPTEKLLAKVKWPAYLEVKYDGMRANIICRDSRTPEIRSRSGNLVDLLGIVESEFAFARNYNCVYDGELIVVDENEEPLPRKTSNGLLTKAQRGTMTEEIAKQVRVVLWDRIPYDKFLVGFDSTELFDRLLMLAADLDLANPAKITRATSYAVHSLEEAQTKTGEMIAVGLEGGILKNIDAPWEDKRSQNLLKFKSEKEADLLCVGIRPGTKKNEGKIGALVCQSSDGLVEVGVGTGLNDEDRAQPPDFYLGKIISIVYNERIVDKSTGKHSLFLPRYIELRLDKTEADHSDRIA
jgi:hypothetical protein